MKDRSANRRSSRSWMSVRRPMRLTESCLETIRLSMVRRLTDNICAASRLLKSSLGFILGATYGTYAQM